MEGIDIGENNWQANGKAPTIDRIPLEWEEKPNIIRFSKRKRDSEELMPEIHRSKNSA